MSKCVVCRLSGVPLHGYMSCAFCRMLEGARISDELRVVGSVLYHALKPPARIVKRGKR